MPCGLAAISEILAVTAFRETSHDQPLGTAAAAGYFVLKMLASYNPAEKTKKLAAELANGRNDGGDHGHVLHGRTRLLRLGWL